MANRENRIAKMIRKAGYTVERSGTTHYVVKAGKQTVCIMSNSSSDRRAWLAMCSDARRSGHPELADLLKRNRP